MARFGTYVTDEGYTVDSPKTDYGWREDRNNDFAEHRWSAGNPAAWQLQYARNKQDYKAILQAAIDWEIAQQKYRQEMSDSERLRDEQREYDSPANQIARERAAGINSDLVGGAAGSSSSGGSSPISAPTMAETDINAPMSSPYATLDRVFSGVQSVASGLSAFSGSLDIGLNFVEKLQTWSDRLQISSNAAKLSQQQVKRGALDVVDDSLSLIGRLGSVLDGTKEYTDEELTQYISDWTGEKDDGSKLRMLKHYMSSPAAQKQYADVARSSMASQAAYKAIPLDFFMNQAEFGYKILAQQTRMQHLFSVMQDSYANQFYTPENGLLSGQIASEALQNQSQSVGLQSDALQQKRVEFQSYLNRYANGLKQIADLENHIQKKLSELLKIPDDKRTPFVEGRILSLQQDQFRLHQLGAQQFEQLRQFALSVGNEQTTFDSQVTIQQGNKGYFVNEKSGYFNEDLHLLNAATWTDVVYNQYGHEDILGAAIGGTALVLSAGLTGLSNVGRAAIGAKASVGAATIKSGVKAASSMSDDMGLGAYSWLMGIDY